MSSGGFDEALVGSILVVPGILKVFSEESIYRLLFNFLVPVDFLKKNFADSLFTIFFVDNLFSLRATIFLG